jgi:signal peptidase I
VLSLLVPGAGHAVVSRTARGVAIVALSFAALVSVAWTHMIGLVAWLALRPAAAIDAALVRRGDRPADLAWLILAGVGFTGWFVIRIFFLEAFQLPSGGDLPTLAVGDHIVIAKTRTHPGRGDLIVFGYPPSPRNDFVQRVVGVAGDRVEVRGGHLSVNGADATAGAATPCSLWDGERAGVRQVSATCVPETVDGKRWTVAHVGAEPRDAAEVVVPAGYVFVLGDNRENSLDSRSFGPVPVGNIRGTALFIWWSAGAPEGVRWDRLGRTL